MDTTNSLITNGHPPQGQTQAPIDHHRRDRGGSRWTKVSRTLCKVSFGINVGLIAVLLAIFLYRNIDDKQQKEIIENSEIKEGLVDGGKSPDTMCVPCDYLGPSVTAEDTLYDSITTTKCGHRICCVKDRQYLYRLVVRVRYTLDLHYTLYDSITQCGHRICCVKDRQYLYRLVVRVRYTLDLHYTLYDYIATTKCGHRICCVKDRQYLYKLVVRVRYTLDLHYTLYDMTTQCGHRICCVKDRQYVYRLVVRVRYTLDLHYTLDVHYTLYDSITQCGHRVCCVEDRQYLYRLVVRVRYTLDLHYTLDVHYTLYDSITQCGHRICCVKDRQYLYRLVVRASRIFLVDWLAVLRSKIFFIFLKIHYFIHVNLYNSR